MPPSYASATSPALAPFVLTAEQPAVHWMPVDTALDLTDWYAVLDPGEVARADRLRLASDRAQFIAAHGLVRRLLAACTGANAADLRFTEGPNGKPLLAGQPSIGFSLTHTRGLVACALARDTEIGVDAEFIDRQSWTADVARAFFSPGEMRTITSAAPGEGIDLFYRLWTLKEAVLKATGDGLGRALDSLVFDLSSSPPRLRGEDGKNWSFIELQPTGDHRLAVGWKHRH